MITTRPAQAGDAPFIEEMLVAAVRWDPDRAPLERGAVLAHREHRHYVEGWPRSGDLGVIAQDPAGRPVGAAWLRFFDRRDPGYGFIAADVPEVSIAVCDGHRGQGIGDRLLAELEAAARDRGLAALALSVEAENPAVRLYERHGYRRVEGPPGACTMRLDL